MIEMRKTPPILLVWAIAFLGALFARVVDQHLTHDTGSNCQQMSFVFPAQLAGEIQTLPGFVHDGGRLQRVVRALTHHLRLCQAAKLVVDPW